jgi:hypothetical protein
MKKFSSIIFLVVFTTAVCHAVPYHSGFDPTEKAWSKKHFELQAFDMPVEIQMPAAPAVVHDLVMPKVKQSSRIVQPRSNSPPEIIKTINSYSMARWFA